MTTDNGGKLGLDEKRLLSDKPPLRLHTIFFSFTANKEYPVDYTIWIH